MKVTHEKARKVLTKVHGFDSLGEGKKDTVELFNRIPCIQVDPIDAAGKNHDLTLFSRIKDYRTEYLSDLLYEENLLFEYYCKMLSILPMESYPVFRNRMEKQRNKFSSLFKKHKEEIDHIMEILEDGPISSLELKEMGTTDTETWRTKKKSNRLLRGLWLSGKISISHRKGNRKYYSLPENVIPERILKKDITGDEETKKRIAEMIVSSSRLVSPSKASAQWNSIGNVTEITEILEELKDDGKLLSIEIDEWRGKLYAHVDDKKFWEDSHELDTPFVRFLAPLDPLLWNRKLFSCIFEHEYVWEIYKKKEDRKYGYYCLPILYNGEYVGLIEPYKDDDVLEIKNLHLFRDVEGDDFGIELKKELSRYMDFLGANDINIDNDLHFRMDSTS
ncbi:MAG: YcaQ family DNA glycosylase [Candidatus Thermoplasmatota archaeon]|nr:YcaQ family DNA glycosylase [Candidatus Thermoplasmatota archaeon]